VINNYADEKRNNNTNLLNSNKENNLKENYHNRLEEIKQNFPNAYESWKEEDDIKLKTLNSENKTISEIAQILKRQPGAIRSRLMKFRLVFNSTTLG